MAELEELENQYELIEKEIEELKKQQKDAIFLLSKEEYEKYKDKIPKISGFWWLRSAADHPCKAFCVIGLAGDQDDYSIWFMKTVRPSLDISNLSIQLSRFINEDTLVYCGVTWKKIDRNLYISETPIDYRIFDEHSNDYEKSEIRKFLLEWHEERKGW